MQESHTRRRGIKKQLQLKERIEVSFGSAKISWTKQAGCGNERTGQSQQGETIYQRPTQTQVGIV